MTIFGDFSSQVCTVMFAFAVDIPKHIQTVSFFLSDAGALSPEKPKRRRRTSSKSRGRTLSGRSMSDQSDTDVEMTEKLGQVDCKERVVETMEVTECSASELHPNMTVNGEINSPGDSPIKGHNSAGSGLPPPELHRELVEFTRDKLHSKNVLSKTDLKRLFSLFLTQCPPEHVLRSGVSDQMLEESILASGGMKLEFQVKKISLNRLRSSKENSICYWLI